MSLGACELENNVEEKELAENGTPSPTAKQFAKLERLALAACECQFRGGKRENCRKAYAAETLKYGIAEGADASYPISARSHCFGPKQDKCISTGFMVLPIDEIVCSMEQAEKLDAIFSNAKQADSRSSKAAFEATKAAFRKMRDDEKSKNTTP